MKQGKDRAKPEANSPSPARMPDAPNQSRARIWLFRSVAVVVLPLFLLVFIEVALRLAGYGHPATFFISQKMDGQEVLVENTLFGLSFFPPSLSRSPSPIVMRSPKPAGVYRIFLFGESAAMGDPRPAFGMGRYLETLLRERYPGIEFEVICTAMTAINSHAIVPIARECAQYQGDLWIVYAGNNEMIGPFGASTVFGPRTPPMVFIRAYLALQRTRIGQWLTAESRQLFGHSATPASWGGLKMFRESQLPPDDSRKAPVYEHFRRNLEDIVRAGQRAGVPVLLSGVSDNLKDCAPFASIHSPPLAPATLTNWQNAFQTAISNPAPQHWNEAQLLATIQQSPLHAEAYYRLGQYYLSVTNQDLALTIFARARDLDALPFRADSTINELIAQTAARHAGHGVFYLPAERILNTLSPGQVAGHEFFLEHVHLNFAGNYSLAWALAELASTQLPAAITNRQTSAWAAPEVCAARLGLTDWNRLTVLEDIAKRLNDAPYTDQCDHAAQYQAFVAQLVDIKRRMRPEAMGAARGIYDEAIKRKPGDHWLHHNFVEFLKETGDFTQAADQMRIVRDLTPHYYLAYLQLGRLLSRQHKYDEAKQSLEQALRLHPDLGEVYLELEQIDAAQGNLDEALKKLTIAQRYRPEDAMLALRRADILNAQKNRPEMIQSLREAVRLRPASWEIRYRLAMELAMDEKNPEAQAEFEEVLHLRPDHNSARLNLGSMLARQDRYEEARAYFQEALRLEPSNEKARAFIQQIDLVHPVSGPQK